ncbi:MAG: AMP-binding protein [Bacteroidota bacterium]
MKPSLSPSSARHIPQATDLVALLQARAADFAEKRAFGYLDKNLDLTESCTFAELDRDARRVAVALQIRGLTGRQALLMYPSGISFIRAFFGCLYAGVVPVPLYPPQTATQIRRMASILMDAKPGICLGHKRVLEQIEQRFAQQWSATGLELLDTDAIEADPDGWQSPQIDPDAMAFLQYTSGSTGQPKGVMVSHRNLLHNVALMSNALETEFAKLVGVGWLPLFHDMGLIGHVIKPIYVAGTSYIMSPMSFLSRPALWLEAISKFKGTHSGAPNFGYARCAEKLADEEIAKLDLSSWSRAYCGAEPIQAEALQRFAKRMATGGFSAAALTPCYGMAETTLMITCKPYSEEFKALEVDRDALTQGRIQPMNDQAASSRLVSCGKPYGGLHVCVVAPETAPVQADGRIGEIWVQGESVAGGYFNQAELTSQIFLAELAGENGGWLRTGDLGAIYDGELYVTGRVKDMIIIRGRNYYPQDFEQTSMEAHVGLQAGGTAAFAVETPEAEGLVIVQELTRNALREAQPEAMLAAIRQAVADIHGVQPHAILLVPRRSIPKTSSGKLQRQACKKAYLRDKLDITARWDAAVQAPVDAPLPVSGPTSEQEILDWILGWVATQTGEKVERLDAEDTLQAYGIDSMKLGAFEGELCAYMGVTWPVNDFLLREPSMRELSQEAWRRKLQA